MISLLPCEDLDYSCATFGYTRNEILRRHGFTFGVSRTFLRGTLKFHVIRAPNFINSKRRITTY